MHLKELAMILNGRQYGDEITKEEEKQAKESGLVVVFGESDDLAEFCGAIYDEVDCYGGKYIYLDKDGIFKPCECECKHSEVAREKCQWIEVEWCEGEYSWSYNTAIPHETFVIMEGEEKYCKGIVFDISSIKE